MAGFGTSFNNDTAPDSGSGGGLHPAGIFEFELTESDVVPTANGKGTLMKYTASGTGASDAPSDNKGLRVWGNINVVNDNAQAQSIGQAQLRALYEAMGGEESFGFSFADLGGRDSSDMHFRPFWGEVIHKQRMSKGATGKYDVPQFNDDGSPKMGAEFKRFMFDGIEDAAKSPPVNKPAATPAPAPTPSPAPAAGRRPWVSKG